MSKFAITMAVSVISLLSTSAVAQTFYAREKLMPGKALTNPPTNPTNPTPTPSPTPTPAPTPTPTPTYPTGPETLPNGGAGTPNDKGFYWYAMPWGLSSSCPVTHTRDIQCWRDNYQVGWGDTGTCDQSTRPPTSKTDGNYASECFAWQAKAWGSWSSQCSSTSTRTREVTCQRRTGGTSGGSYATVSDASCSAAGTKPESTEVLDRSSECGSRILNGNLNDGLANWQGSAMIGDPTGDPYLIITGNSDVTQNITGLVVGRTYTVNFVMRHTSGTYSARNRFIMTMNGTSTNIGDMTVDKGSAWTPGSATFTATATTGLFTIRNIGSGTRYGLDNMTMQ